MADTFTSTQSLTHAAGKKTPEREPNAPPEPSQPPQEPKPEPANDEA